MTGKRLKRPTDIIERGKLIGDILTGQVEDKVQEPKAASPAHEFARKGGLKGGKARAAKLSAQERSEIAQKAAKRRWQK
jgi:hypothetical protein